MAGNTEFEQLLKSVSSLNIQLDITHKLMADLAVSLTKAPQNSPLAGLVKQMEADITRLGQLKNRMAAETLREMRQMKLAEERGAPLGRIQGDRGISSLSGRGALEERNAQAAIERDIYQRARERLSGTVRDKVVQNFRSELDALKRDLEQAAREYQAIRPVGAGLSRAARRQIERDAQSSLPFVPGSGGFRQGAQVGYIPGGADSTVQDAERRYAKILNDEIERRTRESFSDLRGDYTTGLRRQEQGDRLNLQMISAREKAERERIESIKRTVGSEKRYAAAIELATKQGFSIDDLKSVRTRGTGDIRQLQFARTDPNGIRQNLDIYSNPSGRATAGVSNQFRTFGQGVVRDIGELTKWSIALAAVYGPMRKVQELTQTMIENQTRLADATIAVSSAFVGQDEIFDSAAEAANRAGEAVAGVIDAFTLAYRAAGGGANEVERMSIAQTLLEDSLTLSKLSTLDQATAIDTLAAALRQSSGELDQGTELLDKWVRVTKVANVDLTTLATGFAVLGDAAEAAGINTDELNGVIAAIAETGISSGRETANIARSIVAGFQSDKAREELENLGIAVEDTTGQMRPFLDVMTEIYNLRQAGAIDDTQFSRLTLALGGGTRRQAAYASFLENFDRVFEVANESTRASGEAEAALAKQLETVQTALDRMGNAFSSLAQTMGSEGGFLSIIQGSLTATTSLIKVFDGLIAVLGKATPAMAAFIATSLILKSRGQGSIQQALFGAGQFLQPDEVSQRLNQVSGYTSPVERGRQNFATNVLGTNASSGAIQGLVLSLIPAIMNATNKSDRFGETKAAANIIGGVGGGIIGSLTGAGPIIGAAIGVAISEAFVNSTIARKTDIFGYTTPTLGDEFGKGKTDSNADEALKQAEIEIYKDIGNGMEAVGRIIVSAFVDRTESLVEEINKAIESGDRARFEQLTGGYNQKYLQNAGISPELLNQAFKDRKEIQFTPEALAYNLTSPESREGYDVARAARGATGDVPEIETQFARMVEQNRNAFKDIISSVRDTSRQQISGERLSGDVTGAQYARQYRSTEGFDTKALQYYTALGDQFIKINGDVDDAADAFKAFSDITVYGAAESVTEITAIVTEIEHLIELLNNPLLKEDLVKAGGRGAVQERLTELQGVGANALSDVYNEVRLSRTTIPEVQGDLKAPLQTQELQQVINEATRLQEQFYQGFLEIPDEMYESMKESWDEWAQIVEDSGDVFFQRVSEVDPQFFQQAMAKLIEEGKIKSQQASPFGIQQLDITSQQGAGLQGSIDYFSQYLAQNFPQYEQKPEEFGVIFSDYVTDVLHGDNLAMKLALDRIAEINQKQLDGMYNIPEGATFWVPLTAAYYRPKQEEGLGGLPAVDAENTRATDENTQALRDMAQAFRGDLGYSRQAQQLKDSKVGFRGDTGESRQADALKLNRLGYRGDLGYSRLTQEDDGEPLIGVGGRRRNLVNPADSSAAITSLQNVITGLLTELKSLFSHTGPYPGYGGGTSGRGGISASRGESFAGTAAGQQVNPQLNARLELRVDSTTQLLVDGRVLASVVTPYLAADLLRLEASQGTITKRYVI